MVTRMPIVDILRAESSDNLESATPANNKRILSAMKVFLALVFSRLLNFFSCAQKRKKQQQSEAEPHSDNPPAVPAVRKGKKRTDAATIATIDMLSDESSAENSSDGESIIESASSDSDTGTGDKFTKIPDDVLYVRSSGSSTLRNYCSGANTCSRMLDIFAILLKEYDLYKGQEHFPALLDAMRVKMQTPALSIDKTIEWLQKIQSKTTHSSEYDRITATNFMGLLWIAVDINSIDKTNKSNSEAVGLENLPITKSTAKMLCDIYLNAQNKQQYLQGFICNLKKLDDASFLRTMSVHGTRHIIEGLSEYCGPACVGYITARIREIIKKHLVERDKRDISREYNIYSMATDVMLCMDYNNLMTKQDPQYDEEDKESKDLLADILKHWDELLHNIGPNWYLRASIFHNYMHIGYIPRFLYKFLSFATRHAISNKSIATHDMGATVLGLYQPKLWCVIQSMRISQVVNEQHIDEAVSLLTQQIKACKLEGEEANVVYFIALCEIVDALSHSKAAPTLLEKFIAENVVHIIYHIHKLPNNVRHIIQRYCAHHIYSSGWSMAETLEQVFSKLKIFIQSAWYQRLRHCVIYLIYFLVQQNCRQRI